MFFFCSSKLGYTRFWNHIDMSFLSKTICLDAQVILVVVLVVEVVGISTHGKVSSTQLVFVSMFYVCSRRSVLQTGFFHLQTLFSVFVWPPSSSWWNSAVATAALNLPPGSNRSCSELFAHPFFLLLGGKGFQTLLLFKSPWPFDTKARQIGWYRAAAAAIYRQQFSQKGQVFSHCPSKPYLGIHPIDASKWLPWNIMEVLVLQSILKCYHTSISRLQFCSLIKITTSPTPWLKMASNVNKWNQFANKWVTLIHHPHRWNVDVNLVHLLSQITSDPTF